MKTAYLVYLLCSTSPSGDLDCKGPIQVTDWIVADGQLQSVQTSTCFAEANRRNASSNLTEPDGTTRTYLCSPVKGVVLHE